MNKRLKHLVTAGVVLSVSLSTMVGCLPKASNNTANTAAKVDANGEVKKPEKFKVIMDTVLVKEDGQDKFAEEYKKQTGITLEIVQPAHNEYYDKVNLAFSSGDIPDMLEISGQYMTKYATQKGLVQLDDYVKNSKVLSAADKKTMDSERVDGKLYAIPNGASTAPITYVRKDWLDALGMKTPTTYEEFHSMLKAFVSNDPDKNGKADTIGYTAAGVTDHKFLREFWLDAVPTFVQNKEGKYVDGFSEPNFKAGLQRLVDAYKEGLIDKEIITNKSATCRDKWNAGTVGVFQYWNSTWAKTLDDDIKRGPAGKSATAQPIPALKTGIYISRVPGAFGITTKCQNPAAAFKYFIEYMHDGDKGQNLFSHGVEGVHYEMKDNKIVHLPALSDAKKPFAKTFCSVEDALTPYKTSNYDIDPRVPASYKVMGANDIFDVTLPASKTLTKANADLTALRGEVIAKALLGQMSVDQALEKYNKDAKALGMEDILKELNTKSAQ